MPKECSTCLECAHMSYQAAEPGWSEYTPGWDATIDCMKNHWAYDAFNDNLSSLHVKLYMSRSCDDFKAER